MKSSEVLGGITMKKALLILCTLVTTQGFAILHPHHQRNREISKTLTHTDLQDALHGEQVTNITCDGDQFVVSSEHHTVFARVNYLPSDRIGPAQFEIEISETPFQ